MTEPATNRLSIANQIPKTKFRAPGTQEILHRALLIDDLRQQVLTHRLTLISAPAGSGKTTLAADYARSSDVEIVRWLSLDASDNDMLTFTQVMLLASLPDVEPDLTEMVSQGQVPPSQVGNVLINRLDETEQPIVVVLDDLHRVTNPEIHQFLESLIEQMPEHVHLLVTTRYDPPIALARLRARGELAEFRLDALRFRRGEVNELLNRLLGLDIPDALIDQMAERTEGWIAGLRLLALSLEKIDTDKRQQYISDLAQQDRYVFELLAEEVLAQQSDEIRRFLLKTSILDELTPGICKAVTGQSDVQAKLYELHRHNLFLVSLGDGTYRYHALFREFLQAQLKRHQPEVYKELHRRAAEACSAPLQAIHHYVVAEAWDEAIAIIRTLILASSHNVVGTRIEPFIYQFPLAMQQDNAWLLLAHGAITAQRGRLEEARPILEQAQALLQESDDREGDLFVLSEFLRSAVYTDPNLQEPVNFLLDNYSDLITPDERVWFYTGLMWNSVFLGEAKQAEKHILACIDLLIELDQLNTYKTVSQSIGMPLFFFDQGMRPFQRLSRHMQKYAQDDIIVRMGYNNVAAFISLLSGDLSQANEHIRISQKIVDSLGGLAWSNSHLTHTQAAIFIIRAEYDAMDELYRRELPIILELDTERVGAADFMYQYAQCLVAKGRIAEAKAVVHEMEIQVQHSIYRSLLQTLEAKIAVLEKDFALAEQLIQQAVRWQEQGFFSATPMYAPITLPYLYWQMGAHELALDRLRAGLPRVIDWDMPLLVMQEGRGIVPLLEAAVEAGIYPEFCARCIELLKPDDAVQPIELPDGGEILTVREVEILREIVAGASNREIADSLVISENTVKSHITRILSKLGVKSRTEAVARVRHLGIRL